MENSSVGIVLIGDSLSPLADDIHETLHLDILDPTFNNNKNSRRNISSMLKLNPKRGFIFDNSITSNNLDELINWHKTNNIELVFFAIKELKETDEKTEINSLLANCISTHGFKVHILDPQERFDILSRKAFEVISEKCFQEPGLAKQYFLFKDSTAELGVPFLIVSGACSYLYYGKRSLKDIDVIVPSKDSLEQIGSKFKSQVSWSEGSKAQMYYLNLKEIDVNAEVEILDEDKIIKFNWDFLNKNSTEVSFLGEQVNIMSPELLIIFKFSIARFGIDDFNDYKDDYEDVRGVFISQSIDFRKLESLAKEVSATEKLEYGLKLLGIK